MEDQKEEEHEKQGKQVE